MSRLQWTFELLDRVSAPARRIGQALRGTETALRRVGGSGDAVQRALSRSFALSERTARGLATAIAAIGAAQGGLIALQGRVMALRGAIGGVTGAVLNLRNALVAGAVGFAAKAVIDQVGFIEQQRIALSTILGSPIRATAALEWAINFADVTPFETPQVLEAMRSALAMGFNTRQIEPLLTVLGDTASALALGPTGLTELIQVFGQIRSAGKLMTQDVYQLTNRGIPAFEILAKAFKTDVPTLREMIEQGQITSEAALGALYEGLRIRYGGGMAAQSRSIFGLISTLRSRPQTIAFKLEQGEALEPFRKLLQNLADLTDFSKPPGSTIADRLTRSLAGLFQAAFGPLAAATEPERAAEAVISFVDRATAALERVRAVWPQVKAAATEFFAGMRGGFSLLAGLWRGVEPLVSFLGRLAGGFSRTEASAGSAGAGVVRLLGVIVALTAAWRILNLVTLGGAGMLARWGLVAVATLARVAAVGLPSLWGQVAALGAFGTAALRSAGLAMAAGSRIAIAWLIGLGPIGWLVGAIAGVGTALVLAYNKIGWFRDVVNQAWEGIKAGGRGLLDWFSSLPERIGATFSRLPELLRHLLQQAIDLLPPGVRDVVRGLVGGLANAGSAVAGAARGLAERVQGGFANLLGIRSPSRRFRYFGQMMGAGLELGLQSTLDRVRTTTAGLALAATTAMAGAPALELPRPLESAGGSMAVSLPSGPSYTPSFLTARPSQAINITVGPIQVTTQAAYGDAKAIAEEVRAVAVEAVLEALERAAMEEGA